MILKIKKLFVKEGLFNYTFWNLLDKGLVFLLPLTLVYLFNTKQKYVELEYVISIVTIIATFVDLGINGYMFYHYQNAKNKIKAILQIQKINGIYFIVLYSLTLLIILFDMFIFKLNDYIFFIAGRSLFVFLSASLTSYFRLKDKPSYALYFTLSVNIITVIVLFVYYFYNIGIGLEVIFIPQILAGFFALILIINSLVYLKKISINFWQYLKRSIMFSWPVMVQVFIMMYLANYGKIHALNQLTENEGFFLGFTTRLCLIIQLTHTSFVGFYSKNILTGRDLLTVEFSLVKRYTSLMLLIYVIVVVGLIFAGLYMEIAIQHSYLITFLMASYTIIWCFYSFFEMYYSRINRNIYKLYFSVVNGFIFIFLMDIISASFLMKISIALITSTSIALFFNLFFIKKLNFKFI
jgi:O-antigen/teichoic acid export membrane protein